MLISVLFCFFPFSLNFGFGTVSIALYFVLVPLFQVRNCGFLFSDLSNETLDLGLLMFEFCTLNSEHLIFNCDFVLRASGDFV